MTSAPQCEEICFHPDTTYYPCDYCCEENACPDCTMCVEDPDYEEHLCENCGICLENAATKCEECGMCEDCCAETSLFNFCDCEDPVCVESDEWEAHFNALHGGNPGNHSAYPSNVYNFNSSEHWKECRLCDDESHQTNIGAHTFNSIGLCKVCGFRSDTPIVINKQPQDVKTKPSRFVRVTGASDPWNYGTHTALFTVSASGSRLSYQWFIVEDDGGFTELDDNPSGTISGTATKKFRISVSSVCDSEFSVICRIKDSSGNVLWTEPATLTTTHNYIVPDTDHAPDKNGHYMECCGRDCTEVKQIKHDYGSWVWEDVNHCRRSRTCEICGYKLIHESHDDNEWASGHFYDEEIGTNVDNWVYSGETGEPDSEGYCIDNYDNAWKVDWTTHTGWCYEGECEDVGTKVREPHVWAYSESGWQGMYHPPTKEDETGIIWRMCGICNYYQYAVDSEGKAIQWKWGIHPVDNHDCSTSAMMVRNNEDFKFF